MTSKTPETISIELQDRMDDLVDLRPCKTDGNVRSQVIAAMDNAWMHLHSSADGIEQAAESVQNAIDVLTFYQARVRRLGQEEEAKMIARWEARKTA